MNKRKQNSQGKRSNSIDAFLNADQEGEISRPESLEGAGFERNADDLAHRPEATSQEHSLEDTHEMQTPDCLDVEALDEAAENAMKEDDQH